LKRNFILSSRPPDDWTYVYQQAIDKAEEAAAAQATGAIPKVPSVSKSPSVDFVQLSNDLKKHIEEQLCQDFGAAKVADSPVEQASAPVQLPSDKAIPMPAPAAGAIPLRQHESESRKNELQGVELEYDCCDLTISRGSH
jgi:hypothetical protein